MKQRLIAIFSIIMIIMSPLAGTTPVYASSTGDSNIKDWPNGPSVSAESAIVMEASTGLILYEKNIHDEHYPASITKIMTVLLALENSSLGDTVTFSDNAVYDVDADSSRLWVNSGEQMSMRQCLYAIMLESANDVAYGVAEHISGNIKSFADLMNNKAKSLGCQNTHFVNPHGLQNDNHYTSAYDMALITRAAMKNDTFRKIFGTRSYQIPPTNLQPETRYLNNHHKLITQNHYSYDGVIGGKTGYTTTSKYTLVTVAKRGDLELICVIMRDDSIPHEYGDTEKLFDYGFNNFSIYPIAQLENKASLSESPMFTRYNSLISDSDTPISIDNKGYLVLPNNASFKDAKKDISFNSPDAKGSDAVTTANGNNGDKVIGKISYTYDGKYVGGANILYHNVNSPKLIPSGTTNPTSSGADSSDKSGESLRPFIIGGVVGLVVIAIVLYYFLIERPRLKRRHAYNKKKALRKFYKDNDFMDL